SYRLITTLMDHRRFPAAAVVRLYHERWEIESAYFALRHTLLQGHVLRSGDRPGLAQETWALLTLSQPLRLALVTAIETRPGHDLAVLLNVKPRNMLTQLGEWTRLGFFTRTGFGTYRLNTPPSQIPSTNPPDP